MPYRPATLDDLKTAKEVYHRNGYHPNTYSLIVLDYEWVKATAKKQGKKKEVSESVIKSMKKEVYQYFLEDKIYIKE